MFLAAGKGNICGITMTCGSSNCSLGTCHWPSATWGQSLLPPGCRCLSLREERGPSLRSLLVIAPFSEWAQLRERFQFLLPTPIFTFIILQCHCSAPSLVPVDRVWDSSSLLPSRRWAPFWQLPKEASLPTVQLESQLIFNTENKSPYSLNSHCLGNCLFA